jgi:thiol-disulfide isomerase/thioredoxin
MRVVLLFVFIYIIFGCTNKRADADFYEDLNTGKIFNKSGFQKFQDSLNHLASLKGKVFTKVHFYGLLSSEDSIIQPFKYDLRIDNEYIVRATSYPKIGTKVLPQQFITTNGEAVQIGGQQDKPTLINLWFVACRGCVEELAFLNKLQAKYNDKVNFVALTFDDDRKVKKFLEENAFNFKHITGAGDFIKKIKTEPYPENIFINKEGYIVNIEGGLIEFEVEYFESRIEKMLQ